MIKVEDVCKFYVHDLVHRIHEVFYFSSNVEYYSINFAGSLKHYPVYVPYQFV